MGALIVIGIMFFGIVFIPFLKGVLQISGYLWLRIRKKYSHKKAEEIVCYWDRIGQNSDWSKVSFEPFHGFGQGCDTGFTLYDD